MAAEHLFSTEFTLAHNIG